MAFEFETEIKVGCGVRAKAVIGGATPSEAPGLACGPGNLGGRAVRRLACGLGGVRECGRAPAAARSRSGRRRGVDGRRRTRADDPGLRRVAERAGALGGRTGLSDHVDGDAGRRGRLAERGVDDHAAPPS